MTIQPGFTGILLIDKTQDWTSHDVVAKVRRLTGVKRVGHAGTLDPLATGLLIVLVGREFTKLQDQFMKQDKEYEVTARFGFISTSYDSQGDITPIVDWSIVSQLSQAQVQSQLQQFIGTISQTVPLFSAVKINGKKLYEYGHKGQQPEIELPSREVTISAFQIRNFEMREAEQKLEISFSVTCSSGTYIRSLIHDLGQVLGVGAYVTALRRTKIGQLDLKDALKLQ